MYTIVYDTEPHENVSEYKFRATASAHKVCAYGKCFPGYWHEVTLTELKPDTTYYFRVGGPGDWSKEYKTIEPGKPIKLVMVGDSRRPWGEGYELKIHPVSIFELLTITYMAYQGYAAEDPDAIIIVWGFSKRG